MSAENSSRDGKAYPPPLTLFSLCVLFVDDNADAAASLSNLLRANGHQVREAHSGLEAIEITQEFHPDLILMDVVLPGMDGIQASERIRQLPLPHPPQIIELTDDATRLRKPADAAATGGQLLKPVSHSTLQEVVASTVSKVNAMGEARGRYLIASLQLALTVLDSAELATEPARRERAVQSTRASYDSGVTLSRACSFTESESKQVHELLALLEEKLASLDG